MCVLRLPELLSVPGPHTILVVDDADAMRRFVSRALTTAGHLVLEAETAAAARDVLRAHPEIGLLLTDIEIPGDNGIVLAHDVKTAHPALSVLYMTGSHDPALFDGKPQHGEVLRKPFSIPELRAATRSALGDP